VYKGAWLVVCGFAILSIKNCMKVYNFCLKKCTLMLCLDLGVDLGDWICIDLSLFVSEYNIVWIKEKIVWFKYMWMESFCIV